MLSDPQKRDIYDVYGREGLQAGLEVGERLKTRDELRKEWEQFQKAQVGGVVLMFSNWMQLLWWKGCSPR